MTILETIKPIQLLSGSHADTAQTGQGCFMNVIAYLNGEAQITDSSPCVCVTVRRMAIALNDQGNNEQRQRLIPFVTRAMGSATKDDSVLRERTARLRQYGAECQEIINAWRAEMKDADADAYAYADAYADAYAYAYANANADADADAYAYAYAYADAYADADADADAEKKAFASVKRDELKALLFDAGLRYLDAVLPPADEPKLCEIERAQDLVALYNKSMQAA